MEEELPQFLGKINEGIWYDDRNTYNEYSKNLNKLFNKNLLSLIASKNKEKIADGLAALVAALKQFVTDQSIPLLTFETIDSFETIFQSK